MPATDEVRPIQDLLSEAYANRPDSSKPRPAGENSQIGIEGSRNALLPEIDLVGIAQNNALAGQMNPLATNVNTTFIGGYGSGPGSTFHAQISDLWRWREHYSAVAEPDCAVRSGA